MTAPGKPRVSTLLLCAALVVVAGCGGDEFDNEPRPPVTVDLTGVIQDKALSVQPSRVGAGQFRITLTNQTDEARAVVLTGAGVETRVGPIQPRDTATIQKTLEPGNYRIRVDSGDATASAIEPAELTIGPARPASGRRVLLP